MNPEPPSAAAGEAPNDAPASAGVPAPLHETPPASPADASHAAPSPAAASQAPPAATDLSPAANSADTPELSPAVCGARLAEMFPALFVAPGALGPARPIKLRIHADIQARAPGVFTKRMLGLFFSRYTTTNAYLKALTLAPNRFDLDGQPAGEISDEHRRLAAEELARRHALAAERRAAQRPPQRRDAAAAEGEPAAAARREARPGRRPVAGPDARPGDRPAARPPRPSPPSQRPPRQPERPLLAARPEHPAHVPDSAAPHALPADPAQRERALLLRSFEASPLSKANFCALKGITEAALDAALALAQTERGRK